MEVLYQIFGRPPNGTRTGRQLESLFWAPDGPFAEMREFACFLVGVHLFAGFSLMFRSRVGLDSAFLALAVLLWHIRDEEMLMGNQFGAEWEEYRKRSSALLPGIF